MNKIEEITDMMTPEAYTAKKDGKYAFKVGTLLRFDYEGSKTELKVTKIDRKNQRMWAKEIVTNDEGLFVSHHGHLVDASREAFNTYGAPFCTDCEVSVHEPSTEDGEVKAKNRADEEGEKNATVVG